MSAGARRVRIILPRVGARLSEIDTRETVAEIIAARVRGRRLVLSARGIADVCENPQAYPQGWMTNDIEVMASYRVTRAVYFVSGNLRRTLGPAIRPRTIRFGQRSSILGMRWRRWGGSQAKGSGRLEYNRCLPNCAQSRPEYYRVNVTLSRTRQCRGRFRYQRLSFFYPGARPQGLARRYSESFGRLC